jgi:hypothetical protein
VRRRWRSGGRRCTRSAPTPTGSVDPDGSGRRPRSPMDTGPPAIAHITETESIAGVPSARDFVFVGHDRAPATTPPLRRANDLGVEYIARCYRPGNRGLPPPKPPARPRQLRHTQDHEDRPLHRIRRDYADRHDRHLNPTGKPRSQHGRYRWDTPPSTRIALREPQARYDRTDRRAHSPPEGAHPSPHCFWPSSRSPPRAIRPAPSPRCWRDWSPGCPC